MQGIPVDLQHVLFQVSPQTVKKILWLLKVSPLILLIQVFHFGNDCSLNAGGSHLLRESNVLASQVKSGTKCQPVIFFLSAHSISQR